jgi:hypothetical protein
MVRSAATPRVSNHEAMGYAVMIPLKWNTLQPVELIGALSDCASARRVTQLPLNELYPWSSQ